MILDRRYYERKNMETKGAEDVLGGADSWKNVDKTEGKHALFKCNIRNKRADYWQPNARAKVASAVWHTSDRSRFAVPTSLPRAFTSVWSVLRSGVRTDEVVYFSRSKFETKEASSDPRDGRSTGLCSFSC